MIFLLFEISTIGGLVKKWKCALATIAEGIIVISPCMTNGRELPLCNAMVSQPYHKSNVLFFILPNLKEYV